MVSVIIPTHEECENVEALLSRLSAVRALIGEPLEVVVVDSGSGDGTAERARRLLTSERLGRVLVESSGRRGLASAVSLGIQEVRGDLIAVMDADLSHPPELLPELVASVRKGHRLAIASRYIPGGRVGHWSWHRRWLSRAGNFLARPLAGVRDATSGYFVCEASAMKFLKQCPGGFKILLELLVRGDVQRVHEVPYAFTDRVRGSSKLGISVLWCYLVQLVQLYRVRLAGRWRGGLSRPRKEYA